MLLEFPTRAKWHFSLRNDSLPQLGEAHSKAGSLQYCVPYNSTNSQNPKLPCF